MGGRGPSGMGPAEMGRAIDGCLADPDPDWGCGSSSGSGLVLERGCRRLATSPAILLGWGGAIRAGPG